MPPDLPPPLPARITDGENYQVDLPSDEEMDEMIQFNSIDDFIEVVESGAIDPHDDEDHDDENDEAEDLNSPREDNAELTFKAHKGPIYGCGVHPHFNWIATGGEDDAAFLWDCATGDVLYKINDHKDTVVETHFSYDGMYLATGDMAGHIFVHKIQHSSNNPNELLNKVWEYSMGDMTWMRWHPSAHVLLAGGDEGEIYIWRIPKTDCKILPSPGVGCEIGAVTSDGKKLLTAYTSGEIRLWDIKNNTEVFSIDINHPSAHTKPVNTVACHRDSPLYVSGGQDGMVQIFSNNGVVASLSTEGCIESVAISPCQQLKLAASGTLEGDICIWDLTKHSLRVKCETPLEQGITCLRWISDYILVAGTMQGFVYGYDGRNGKQLFVLSGHTGHIYEVVFCAMQNAIISVSEDETAKVFKLPVAIQD